MVASKRDVWKAGQNGSARRAFGNGKREGLRPWRRVVPRRGRATRCPWVQGEGGPRGKTRGGGGASGDLGPKHNESLETDQSAGKHPLCAPVRVRGAAKPASPWRSASRPHPGSAIRGLDAVR